jgi:hypothetical protein
MRNCASALALATLIIFASLGSAAAKRHHRAASHTQATPATSGPAVPAPSVGDLYRNHVVEDGMTQDQLDRSPGR